MDADTKLCISYLVGGRSAAYAYDFMLDVADRLANRVQLTSDAHSAYFVAVKDTFGNDIDYAQLMKIYGPDRAAGAGRYSPPVVIGAESERISGNPEPAHVSTSFAERQNLTMRMGMRRFTRLTNGFSKKFQNYAHNVALHFMHYNFCRVHQTLRVTPAMAARLADHVWELEELVSLFA